MGFDASSDDRIPLCTVCTRQLRGPEEIENVKEPFNCALCFGVLDEKFVDEVVAEVKFPFNFSKFSNELKL
ncbi:unnamed protein product [Onchocerca flexuosa]|uniref:TFIIB-type domain-containing protein n=1 Tax=Onchocerca flexuosa TaxID=387005 RepID=A0A183HTC5_9BILA|nr:unnamed protein product [Onchocerca flexuosa]